jgi:mannose-6-phosphate isomerase-like protein (cupin superfamily)
VEADEIALVHAIRRGSVQCFAIDEGRQGNMAIVKRAIGHSEGAIPLHPLPLSSMPRTPMHRHHREDEYSFVLEGATGALLGHETVLGHPGDVIFKPRCQWHTFWNAGDAPAHVLEVISPAGFENYFRELSALVQAGAAGPAGASRPVRATRSTWT